VQKSVRLQKKLLFLLCNFGLRFLDRQEQFELSGQLILRVQAIAEVNPPNPTIGMDLNTQSFHVVGAVSATREIAQVELDLVPAFV
jgi:hypothetical protein